MDNWFSFISFSNPIIQTITSLLLSALIGFMVYWLTFKFLKSRNNKQPSLFKEKLIQHLNKPISYLFPALGIYTVLSSIEINEVWVILTKVLLIIMISWTLIMFMEVAENVIRIKFEFEDGPEIKERKILTQLKFMKNIALAVIVVLAIAFVAWNIPGVREFGKGLLTSAGVVGIIVGVAAQKSIANLIAGFQIAFAQPIKIDDIVIVENEWGTVEDITLTYVVIKTWDLRRLVLPLNYFNEKPFENWTLSSHNLIGKIILFADYSLPVQNLRMKFHQTLKESLTWDQNHAMLLVTKANECNIEIRMTFSAKNSSDVWAMRCQIREKMIDFIQKNHPNSLPKTRSLWESNDSL